MNKKYAHAVFVGRFQPFHNGHYKVLEQALNIADEVIIVIGSADQPRTPKNPWTAPERTAMIESVVAADFAKHAQRVKIVHVRDQKYNDQQWAASIQEAVESTMHLYQTLQPFCIIGHNKDESSYYLKMFPQWELVDHAIDEMVNATDLRELYLEGKNLKFLQSLLSPSVYTYLQEFSSTDAFELLCSEYRFLKQYKKDWEIAPYPPTFVTTDAVVVQSGHILLVERGGYGAGQWALPGGFLNQNERMEDGMIRELREETKLKVPAPVLKGSIKASKIFDHPARSLRGRTITNAFLIELPPGPLPKVKGSDDALEADWFSLTKVKNMSDQLFEDHSSIIEYFLGRI